MKPFLAALLLCSAVLLGGCAAQSASTDGSSTQASDVKVEATQTTGVIRGIVVDDAVRPLSNAVVTLTADGKLRSTNTTVTGGFGFQGLAPGTYFVKAHKLGYRDSQTSAEVKAGDSNPAITKVQLAQDAGTKPYYSVVAFKGFIVCTTSFVAVCGAPNVVSNVLLCPAFHVCQGNVTDDRFGWDFYYEPNATMIQSELVWQSSQPFSTQLTLSMENISDCTADSDSYIELVTGDSPLHNVADAKEIATGTIGGSCSIFHSIFSGDTAGTPAGVTINQDFRAFSHSFYHFTPPEGWTFSKDGDPPVPQ